MGLSDEERFSKLVWATKRMTAIGDRLKENSDKFLDSFENKIVDLLDMLWPALLHGRGNSGFWIFGPSIDEPTIECNSLFDVAILHHGYDIQEQEREHNKSKQDYSICDYVDKFRPDLLKTIQNGRESILNMRIVGLMQEIEFARYALNRYKDAFSDGLREFEDTLARIEGCIFDIVASRPIYLEAYILSQIGQKILTYDEEDIVNNAWFKFNLHHDWKVHDRNTEELHDLLAIWKDIQFRDITVNERMLITFKILSFHGNFHYDHQQKELLCIVNKYNKGRKHNRIGITKLKRYLSACKRNHKIREKESRDSYQQNKFCWLTNQYPGKGNG